MNHDSLDPNVIVEVHFKEGKDKEYKKESTKSDEKNVQICPENTRIHPTAKIDLSTNKETKETQKSSKNRVSKYENFEIRMITTRPVKAGEELCFDYGPRYPPSKRWAS